MSGYTFIKFTKANVDRELFCLVIDNTPNYTGIAGDDDIYLLNFMQLSIILTSYINKRLTYWWKALPVEWAGHP